MFIEYPRGSIFWAGSPTTEATDSIQNGMRPVLILSNNANNTHSTVLTVVPLTSQPKSNLPVHVIIPSISGEGLNTILCEQIKTIPKTHLKKYCGMLSEEALLNVEKAVNIHLGFTAITTENNTTPPKNETQPRTTLSKIVTNTGYSAEYKQQYLKDAEKMDNAALAKKYGITAKAAWARTASWRKQFK